jgi:hypothetical protein
MLLACCSHRNLADLPAPLQVDLPTTCEDILAPVPVPVDSPDDDQLDAYFKNRAAAIVASATVDLGRNCLRDQRQDYAGKGVN